MLSTGVDVDAPLDEGALLVAFFLVGDGGMLSMPELLARSSGPKPRSTLALTLPFGTANMKVPNKLLDEV